MRTQMTNRQFYARVKASFVARETSLHAWCVSNKIHRQNAKKALLGEWQGDKATLLRERIAKEVGISQSELAVANHDHLA
jgi:hypothetical protein